MRVLEKDLGPHGAALHLPPLTQFSSQRAPAGAPRTSPGFPSPRLGKLGSFPALPEHLPCPGAQRAGPAQEGRCWILMSEVSPPPRAGPGPAPLSFPREACSAQVLALPPGVGAVQTRAPDTGQHFRSPGQSTSRVHGEVDTSGPTTGQIPGLDANSEDRFRAGGASDQSSGRCWQQSLFFFFFAF